MPIIPYRPGDYKFFLRYSLTRTSWPSVRIVIAPLSFVIKILLPTSSSRSSVSAPGWPYRLAALQEMGFEKTQVYTTLELRMKCGIGKCGRCNIGSKYVCKDGPVFRCDEVDELPDEY